MKPTTRINSKLKVKNLQYVLEVREILEIETYQQEKLKCHSVMIPGQVSTELMVQTNQAEAQVKPTLSLTVPSHPVTI